MNSARECRAECVFDTGGAFGRAHEHQVWRPRLAVAGTNAQKTQRPRLIAIATLGLKKARSLKASNGHREAVGPSCRVKGGDLHGR
jgi:hypothetical protein